jgi:hypothetical protein
MTRTKYINTKGLPSTPPRMASFFQMAVWKLKVDSRCASHEAFHYEYVLFETSQRRRAWLRFFKSKMIQQSGLSMRHPGSPNDPLAVKYLTQRAVIRNIFPHPRRRPEKMASFFQKTRSKITANM